MSDEELRRELDELYTIAALGYSPLASLASDKENEQLRQRASKDIDSLLKSHTQQIALEARIAGATAFKNQLSFINAPIAMYKDNEWLRDELDDCIATLKSQGSK